MWTEFTIIPASARWGRFRFHLPAADSRPRAATPGKESHMRAVLAPLLIALALATNVLHAAEVPGVVIDHQSAATRQYVGSPSIVVAENGDYIATHDLFGPGSTCTTSAETRVFVSGDRGATWKQTSTFDNQFWSNLFRQGSRVYLMGTSAEYGRIVIRVSGDNGQSWSDVHYLTSESGYHTAPVPMAVHVGRIYRAFEYHPAGPWGSFQAFIMSASLQSDLSKASSWTFSNRLSFPPGSEGNTWLEGNAVVARDGSIVDVLRVASQERAAILRLRDNTLQFEQFVDLPGGAKKFTIRFDPQSKLYWSLVNPAIPGDSQSVVSPGSVRNTLALVSSPDLIQWTPRVIVLHHPDAALHGFQYVDWQFEGPDIIAVSRTAYDAPEGSAHTFHDANYLTFHRVVNFRELGSVDLAAAPIAAADVVSPEQMQKWIVSTGDKAKLSGGVASQPMGRYANHTATLTTRSGNGEAEQHRDWSDIFVVVAGEATLLSGGHLAGARIVSDGEWRGTAVEGGHTDHLAPGSVVHIGPRIPHLILLEPGRSFSYFVVKINTQKTQYQPR
jgi:hypothetical protein